MLHTITIYLDHIGLQLALRSANSHLFQQRHRRALQQAVANFAGTRGADQTVPDIGSRRGFLHPIIVCFADGEMCIASSKVLPNAKLAHYRNTIYFPPPWGQTKMGGIFDS
jgi:hypothetical protein